MNYAITPTEVNYAFYVLFSLWSLFSFYYIVRVSRTQRPKSVIIEIYDSIPTVFTTLGVLGTFVGIFVGLSHFDTYNVDTSIPLLLSGLKTAFLTSIIGLILSLIFGKISRIVMEKAERAHNPLNDTSELSTEALLLETLVNQIGESNHFLETTSEHLQVLTSQMTQLTSQVQVLADNFELLQTSQEQISQHLKTIANKSEVTASTLLVVKTADTDSQTTEQTIANSQLAISKLETNLNQVLSQTADLQQTEKLKASIVQGLDQDLIVDQISQVVVIDHAKEKLQAYQNMEQRLEEVTNLQKTFFNKVTTELNQLLDKFTGSIVNSVQETIDQSQQTIQKQAHDTLSSVKFESNNLAQAMLQGTNNLAQILKEETAGLMKFMLNQTTEQNNVTQQVISDLNQKSQTLIETLNQVTKQLEASMRQVNSKNAETITELNHNNSQENQKVLDKFVETSAGHLQKFLHVTQEFAQFFRQVSVQINNQSHKSSDHIDQVANDLSLQYQQVNQNIEKMNKTLKNLYQK